MDKVLEAIKHLDFVFAKSMPKIPHYYTVKNEQNKPYYETLFFHILYYGYDDKFFSKTYRYCDICGFKYWIMADNIEESRIINRRKSEQE